VTDPTTRRRYLRTNILLGIAVLAAVVELTIAVSFSVTPAYGTPASPASVSGTNNTPPLVGTFNLQAPMVANAFGTKCFQQNVYESRYTSNHFLIQTFIFGVHWCSRGQMVISGTKWWCKVGGGTLVVQYDPCSANFGPAFVLSRYFEGDWDLAWIGRPDEKYDVDIKGRIRWDGAIYGSHYADLGFSS
jgi:hypothetical protein